MKISLKNFSFPYTKLVLYFSAIMIFVPVIYTSIISDEILIDNPQLFGIILRVSSLFATIGFIYSILGFHFKTIRGDELKFRIHLESLNVAFTASIVSLFLLIFIFLNFFPTMLNYIIVILAIVAIVAYLLASEMIKEKYQ